MRLENSRQRLTSIGSNYARIGSNPVICYTSASLRGEVCVHIDLSTIDDQPIDFDEELTVSPDRLDDPVVTAPVTVRLEGVLRPVGDGYRIDGQLAAGGKLACSRCLEPAAWQVRDAFSVEYRRTMPRDVEIELNDDELDVAFLDGDVLDLEEVAAEQLLLALPMRFVCDEQCAGLCPRCGANRNHDGACVCEPETDPRWDALRQIEGNETTN
jgi:uncharacterized protein